MKGDDPKKVYADIIDLPYKKNPNRQHMSLYDRAAQFAPFAALSGYDDMVREESRLTEKESELSDYEIEVLNRKLGLINDVLDDDYTPEITVTYFIPDNRKAGGSYANITALVKAVDVTQRQLILYGSYDIENRKIDPVKIDFERIRDIRGELVDYLED